MGDSGVHLLENSSRAKTSLSATQDDLAELQKSVKDALELPIVGVVSDGQLSIRKAVETALPEAAHGLCHFHYLKEAAKPVLRC